MAKITVQKTEINYGEFATNRNQAGLNSFNQIAIQQMQVLEGNSSRNLLK